MSRASTALPRPYRPRLLQRGDFVPGEAVGEEDLLGVFAEFGGAAADRSGSGTELDRGADDLAALAAGVVVLDDVIVREHLRVLDDLAVVLHRRAGQALLAEEFDPLPLVLLRE